MQPSPETTLAIILGASVYPKVPKLSNPAFQNSADAFMKYLLNRDGFGLPEKNLLNLFDSSNGPSDQNDQISAFLQGRIKELKESKVTATDLILYYVGHGTFVDPGSRYILALRNLTEGSEEISGFPIKTLSNTIKEHTPSLRRYVILDSCFSASAFDSFQSAGPLEVAREKTEVYLPPKGTALLCASGPKDPAKTPPGMKYTMFSSVLLDILERGSFELPERFSLADLGLKTEHIIQERFSDAAVRPQILSPDQTVGDVAKLAIFPNLGLGVRVLSEGLEQLRTTISELARTTEKMERDHDALQVRLDDLAERMKGGVNVQNPTAVDAAGERKREIARWHGLMEDQWNRLPGRIKSEIMAFRRRRFNGHIWLFFCCLISSLTWGFSFYNLTRFSDSGSAVVLGDVLISICGLIVIIQSDVWDRLVTILIPSKAQKSESTPAEAKEVGPWENYDIVVLASEQKLRSVFGLEFEKFAFSLSHLIYAITLIGTVIIRFYHLLPSRRF